MYLIMLFMHEQPNLFQYFYRNPFPPLIPPIKFETQMYIAFQYNNKSYKSNEFTILKLSV